MKRARLTTLIASAANRAAGYLEACLDRAESKRSGFVFWTDEVHASLRSQFPPLKPVDRWPVWALAVAKLRISEEMGVGDTIARLVGPLGGDAFKTTFLRVFGFSCGCEKRQADLNARWPYSQLPDH